MIRRGSLAIALAVLHGLQMPVTARADPDEAWLHRAELPAGVQPLLVLILDRSEAAARSVLAAPGYDPAQDYGASLPPGSRCERGRVYWRRGPGPAPDCATQAGLDAVAADATRAFHCDTARAALTRQGYFVASRAAQWHEDGRDGRWTALDPGATGVVECRADRARHGAAPGTWYASDGARGPWSAAAVDEIRWDRAPLADPYVFYLGNYLNYLRAPGVPREIAISELARQSLAGALRATDGIEAALLRFAAAADRAYVSRAAVPAAALATDLEAMAEIPMDSGAPLAEALAEAAAWLAGGHVHSGEGVAADPRAFDAATGDYASPFVHACRPITVAYATAGEPSGDESAPDAAAALPGFVAATGGCGSDCLRTLAGFIAGSDLRSAQAGRQSAPLRWLAPAPAPPAIAAAAGVPAVLRVDDPHAYVELIAHAHQRDTAVPAGPALSGAGLVLASAAERGTELYFGLTVPRARQRWLGNLFRYGMRAPEAPLSPPVIVDRDGDPAIDAQSGLPLAGSRSAWSESPDSDLLAGGANGRLPVPSERRVFADLATGDITDARNRVMPGNALLSRHVVGLGSTDPETPEDVIAWLLEARPVGDPGLHAPRVVGNQEDLAVVFTATQDGLLHAFDAQSGIERWAWMPRALLSRLAGLMRDEATTARGHGIDGPLVVHRFDPDGDGAIDTLRGEHHWLLFGLGRGGNAYYALDIADPDRPRLLWTQEGAARRGAEAKAEPVVARLSTGDPGQSARDWIVMRTDAGTLQVLDAETGRSLWSAGAAGEPELSLPGLTGTFASAPRALDLDGDGRIDRAYLVDTSGGLWRLDFVPADSPAELASARRIARLGDGSQRFLASPDVSIARLQGRREIALAIGSGRIDRPRDVAAVDRVYVVFDRRDERELTESDLHDATDRESAMPPSAPGWYLRLDRHGAGEKVVGPGLTFDHVLRFQTYEPLPQSADAPCGPPRAMHRRYARDVRTGMPATRGERPEDREELEIEAEGLPPALRYAFPAATDTPCDGCRARPFGIVGPHIFDPGYAGDPVRTSWRKLPLPDSR